MSTVQEFKVIHTNCGANLGIFYATEDNGSIGVVCKCGDKIEIHNSSMVEFASDDYQEYNIDGQLTFKRIKMNHIITIEQLAEAKTTAVLASYSHNGRNKQMVAVYQPLRLPSYDVLINNVRIYSGYEIHKAIELYNSHRTD